MKKFIILLILSTNLWAKNVNNTFSDHVKVIKPTKDGIKIGFELHAAFYQLKTIHPKFLILKNQLEELQKSQKAVKITVDIHDMEIKEISLE